MASDCVNYRKLWEKEVGKIPKGWHIHHLDGDKTNNDLTNLICVSREMHAEIHKVQYERYGNKQDFYAWNLLTSSQSEAISNCNRERVKWDDYVNPMKGRNHSTESKEKMKEAKLNKIIFNGKQYRSIREAHRATGISRYFIKRDCIKVA